MGGQHHTPAALTPVKTRYPLYRRLIMNLQPAELLNCSQFVLPYAKLKNPQYQVDFMLFLFVIVVTTDDGDNDTACASV